MWTRLAAFAWTLGLVGTLPGTAGTAHAFQQQGVGVVIATRGEVAVSHLPDVAARTGRSATEPLRFRDDVFFHDVIDTQQESAAKLLLKGRAIFTVRELSRVELKEGALPADPGRTRSVVNVLAGAVRALVQKDLLPQNELEIHTPNAASAIRGTELVVEVFQGTTPPPLPGPAAEPAGHRGLPAPDVVSRFYVREGVIEVEGLRVGAGQGVEKVGNLPARLFQFSPSHIQHVLSRFAMGPGVVPPGGNQARPATAVNGQPAGQKPPIVASPSSDPLLSGPVAALIQRDVNDLLGTNNLATPNTLPSSNNLGANNALLPPGNLPPMNNFFVPNAVNAPSTNNTSNNSSGQ